MTDFNFGDNQQEIPQASVNQRSQLQYPLDAESKGALKLALEDVQKDVIQKRNRVQFTIPTGATSFQVASDYMVLTGAAGVTIATIVGGKEGQILTLSFTDANITITDTGTSAADTINLSGSFVSTANMVMELLFDGTSWREISRASATLALAVPITVANGGTGVATLGDAGVLIGNGTGVVQVTGAGTSGQVLTSNGAGNDPTFQASSTFAATNGTFTRGMQDANGDTTVTHSLGKTPTRIRIKAEVNNANAFFSTSTGAWSSGSGSSSAINWFTSAPAGQSEQGSNIAECFESATIHQKATMGTVNGTTFTLTWTKTGSPANRTITIMWEAEG